MAPVLIVPYHRYGRARAVNAAFVRRRLRVLHGDWPLVIAAEPLEGWSKARAVNRAAACAFQLTDVVIVHDGDVLASPDSLRAAVRAVDAREAPWAVPHGHVYRLDPGLTLDTLRGDPSVQTRPVFPGECARLPYTGLPGGGLFVVHRDAWATVGGFDERFEGWGSEDVSLGYALDTLVGLHWRAGTPLWHLWHPSAPRTDQLDRSQALEAQYLGANGKPGEMGRLIDAHDQTG